MNGQDLEMKIPTCINTSIILSQMNKFDLLPSAQPSGIAATGVGQNNHSVLFGYHVRCIHQGQLMEQIKA